MPEFLEFFAGGGMARAGLGTGWSCLFANDFDETKASSYRRNWGGDDLLVEDINLISASQLPERRADLAWASFPCQDLSLAGNYEGIGRPDSRSQTRSGTFWPFWSLMRQLMEQARAPRIIALENVFGALTSNGGGDFAAIAGSFSEAGYCFGALVVDARLFLPQSRPRVFIIGVHPDLKIPPELCGEPSPMWHPQAMRDAWARMPSKTRQGWIWWNLPSPPAMSARFADLIQEVPEGCEWHSPQETARLIGMMNPLHLGKVEAAKKAGRRVVGGVYKRTRIENGVKMQRAEVRFDELAGCLRTPGGGSSRQSIILVEGARVRSRLLSPREAARLMGLPDTYLLPSKYNEAYHLAGDGVAVPVVRWLAAQLFEPILASNAFVAAAAE
ncbi:DNA cytosine methyltransferase [Novispirillum itersonii]|uniref:DNA (cytosine-5-)-methyltransferase n=1 Tax=Novispirillum itersonii TaxID=189 RepID=A0A7W9ZCG0_NOVIT|nr:DNA cytosine methyltransferase [Novispirillum itersonii]MBB6208700.1 DNA (cytosine-5)-methyltransferase 1 [Novispirillum itersonii]